MKLNYFNFKKIEDKFLLTNDFGNFVFLKQNEFKNIFKGNIVSGSKLEQRLVDAGIIYNESDLSYSDRQKYILRERKGHVNMATSLHIFVVTTACNLKCIYCQANNGENCSNIYMKSEVAKKAVDIALQSPSNMLSFEFQGGEPLLNFEIIKYIVEYTEENKKHKNISYNLVSNLLLLNDEMIEFFVKYHFGISTSFDGSMRVHNNNRRYKDGNGTFSDVKDSIDKLRKAGIFVGAIETTTRFSLDKPEEIVDEYVNMGFESIFLRPLTPLGKATANWDEIGYSAEEFLEFYRRAMDRIISINQKGIFIKETHSAILLSRINGYSVNYMELRSPCGAAVGQLAYYADGNIFTCDEARMLYEMGQDAFKVGNVYSNNYMNLVDGAVCKTVCASSILEAIPSCCDCVYQPYCGTCPVVSYAMTNDVIEKEPRGYRCSIYKGMMDYLFSKYLREDEKIIKIFNSWSN